MKDLLFASKYKIIFDDDNCINAGNYSDVFKAVITRAQPNIFCKCVRLLLRHNFDADDDADTKIEMILKIIKRKSSTLNNEVKCLLELQNEPHIIHIQKIKSLRVVKDNMYIGLELCKGGDLFTYLEKHKIIESMRMEEPNAIIVINQLILALKECHKHWIVHGDLKLENIGLTEENDINNIKLLDFGGSYIIQDPMNEQEYPAKNFHLTVTPHYIPPELLSSKYIIKERELIYADLWELGIISYVLITGFYPFTSKYGFHHVFKKILHGAVKWPKDIIISDNMKLFISGLLMKCPTSRKIIELNGFSTV